MDTAATLSPVTTGKHSLMIKVNKWIISKLLQDARTAQNISVNLKTVLLGLPFFRREAGNIILTTINKAQK